MQVLGIILSLTTPIPEGRWAATVASLDQMPDVTVGPRHGHYLTAALEVSSRREARAKLAMLEELEGVDVVHVTSAFLDQPETAQQAMKPVTTEVQA